MDPKAVYKENKSFYGKMYHIARWAVRNFWHHFKVLGLENLDRGAAVFVARHLDMVGPVSVIAWAPIPKLRTWALSTFTDAEATRKHFGHYTLPQRRGVPKFLCMPLATVLSWVVPGLCQSLRCIPVYRGSRDIIKTMKLSVDALERGESLLVMPEVDYADRENPVGDLYSGFVQLGRLYCKRNKTPTVKFYPICTDRKARTVTICPAVEFCAAQPYQSERDRVLEKLRDALENPSQE